MLWFLAFCVLVAFSLCPLAVFATNHTAIAVKDRSHTTSYINAPVYVAGDTDRSEATGSADPSTGKLISDNAKNKALFKTDDTIDTEVLADLLHMVDNEKVWGSTTENTDAPTYLSAKNFGQYGNQTSWSDAKKGNSQILVKLFETTTDSTNSVNTATQQYWQAVYRSINGENDVLTLYMTNSYTDVQFNPDEDTTYNGKTYRYEGNYSQSYLRDKTVLPLYNTLKSKYSALDKYVVAPNEIPGLWQSSAYQTSANSSGTQGSTGSSGYTNKSTYYGINNGLDGLGTKHSSWSGEIESNYTDKLWVPSGFEVLHTGYTPTSGAKLAQYDGDNSIVYLSSYSASNATPRNSNTNGNRTGLWELNGYDRANMAGSWAWLRSGSSSYDDDARGIYLDGSDYNGNVYSNRGARVALHLNLGTLKSQLYKSSVSINSSIPNTFAPTCTLSTYSADMKSTSNLHRTYTYLAPNSITRNGKILATFTERNSGQINSFILKTSTQSSTINVSGANGSGSASGICDYSYNYDNDKLNVTISNLSASTEIIVNDVKISTKLSITATNNAPNSLLILTIMDGNIRVAEYSCISGTVSVNMLLDQNKTYKILATRPFGSNLVAKLDDVLLAPTNFACYIISTETKSVMNLSFVLSGDGSWKNCIVI